jgi:hypothetical protein
VGIEQGITRRLEELRATARYDRERRDLYRAKTMGPRPTSPARLEDLQRISALSESRLRRAEREAATPPHR